MSSIGSPLTTSLVQAAQAQVAASGARDRERAESAERSRRAAAQVELSVSGVELPEALRQLPQNDSEQAEVEQRSRERRPPSPEDRQHVDVKA